MTHLFKIFLIVISTLLLSLIALSQEDSTKQAKPETIKANPDSLAEVTLLSDRYVITYYHGKRRCATCEKLEAYATEAVKNGFTDEMKSGLVVWQTVNYDEEANEHVKKDYGIFSQSVIVSHIVDDKETEWTNLKKIWDLVGDKDKYVEYVQTESKVFMTPKAKE